MIKNTFKSEVQSEVESVVETVVQSEVESVDIYKHKHKQNIYRYLRIL